jgi:hypothetical protein
MATPELGSQAVWEMMAAKTTVVLCPATRSLATTVTTAVPELVFPAVWEMMAARTTVT